MIRIYTTDNIELDLNPDTTFEIEICNPMFEQERLAAAFSTSIAFPLSPGNINTFKCLAAFKNIPEVRKLEVEIYEDVVFIASGTLVFEGINEDGELEYQFVAGDEIPDGDSGLKSFIKGKRSGVYYPLLSIKDYTGKGEYEVDEDGELFETGKYFNRYVDDSRRGNSFACMRIHKILEYLGLVDEQTDDLDAILKSAAVLPFDDEMTVRDFLENIMRLFCLAAFSSHVSSGIELKSIETILDQKEYIDLSEKVSDTFSCSIEPGKGYRLSFANDRKIAQYNTDFENNVTSRIWGTFDSLEEGLASIWINGPGVTGVYRVLRVSPPEERDYSIKSALFPARVNGSTGVQYVRSILSDFLGYTETQEEINDMVNGEQFDASAAFDLVECNIVDDIISATPGENLYRVTPLVLSSENKGVLIGNLYTDGVAQLTDGDVAGISGHKFTRFAEPMSAERLYYHRHWKFAEWLYEDRQVVDVDVDMTAFEIANYKIWQKVMFDNAFWLAKKLTVMLSARNGILGCRGEFIAF